MGRRRRWLGCTVALAAAAALSSCSALDDAAPGCDPAMIGEGPGTVPTPHPGPYPRDLFTIADDGTSNRLTDTQLLHEPSMSADGSTIAATRSISLIQEDNSSDYDRTSVVILDSTGSEQSRIPTVHGWDDLSPALSPDGETVAFLRQRQSAAKTKLVLSDLAGEHLRVLLTADYLDRPAWSSDGRLLAMHQQIYTDEHRYEYTDELLIVRADDGATVQHTPWEGEHRDIDWSPDGTTILGSGGAGSLGELNRADGSVSEIAVPAGWDWRDATYAGATNRIRVIAHSQGIGPNDDIPPVMLLTVDRRGVVHDNTTLDQDLQDLTSGNCTSEAS